MKGKVYSDRGRSRRSGIDYRKGKRMHGPGRMLSSMIIWRPLPCWHWLIRSAEHIYVGKKGGDHTLSQDGINQPCW